MYDSQEIRKTYKCQCDKIFEGNIHLNSCLFGMFIIPLLKRYNRRMMTIHTIKNENKGKEKKRLKEHEEYLEKRKERRKEFKELWSK